jgi:hypothetical protein
LTQLSRDLSTIAAKRAVARIQATTKAHLAAAARNYCSHGSIGTWGSLYFDVDRAINSAVVPPRIVGVKS